ncbi:MAG: haloalkane dehalogenase [Robiginitomaculum sp.]|nr:MAG: haloalkane dehalogenase [Robiginitomaculum sp.]
MTSEQSPRPYGLEISADFPFKKKTMAVLNSTMTYVDEGEGPTVVFLHGNPTSSYLWRNIIPHVLSAGYRAIAPDLIGMGDSGTPDIGYTFDEHAAFLDALMAALDLKDITLVIHDWGSALGMRYARLNPDNVCALAFMEAIMPPAFPAASYEAMGSIGDLFKSFRTKGEGEDMILANNFFVETLLPKMGVARGLTEAEMAHYRAPYPTPQSRLPTLQWPRELPIAGMPKATHDAIIANGQWLTSSEIPKLYFYATPGAINPAPVVDWLIENVPHLETRFLGTGTHYVQEDHPDLIGTGIVDWLRRL